jgi:prolyl-tRNA editing enzyme YbaK/EbsC (Cys-tRNA(Pro) deacylase)
MVILQLIRELLTKNGFKFDEMEHEPTLTSEQAARVRGVDLEIGGKALLIKTDKIYRLFVLSAALQLDSGAIRSFLGVRRTRFATPEELKELTGLVPGSVPPIGRPILPFELYVDESIGNNREIAFNAGSLTNSIMMSVEDYLSVTKPTIFRFSKTGE